jgi:hypothetical protein
LYDSGGDINRELRFDFGGEGSIPVQVGVYNAAMIYDKESYFNNQKTP